MLKKISEINKKLLVIAVVLIVAIAGIIVYVVNQGGNNSDDDDSNEDTASEWSVDDIMSVYEIINQTDDSEKEDGNDGYMIKTVYGTVKVVEDYTTALNATKSQMTVFQSDFDDTVSSFLAMAGAEELNDDFITNYCAWKGINSVDEFNDYINNLLYMLNAYTAVWTNLSNCFELVEYEQALYDTIYDETIDSYNQQIELYYSAYGITNIEEYCSAMGISVSDFTAQFDIEGEIKARMINVILCKENGLAVNEASEERILGEVAFQSGLTSIEDARESIASNTEELQLVTVSYLMLEWIAENVQVIDDMELEAAVVDQLAGPEAGDTVAEIVVKDFGTIKVRLFSELAPLAVENFSTHSTDGYYDGLIFHRVIDNFMIQGGDPNGDGTGGESIWGGVFKNEISFQLFPVRGALCMANAGTDTNGSQFFIVQSTDYSADYGERWAEMGVSEEILDYYENNGGYGYGYGSYTVFGQVYEGMEVVDAIAAVETDDSTDKPLTDVVIESITISTY